MEKSWFKYGNFDTRDYPNLLIELLPNSNIPEKNTEQVNVLGQNGSIIYPGGLKNTTRAYNIALISDKDDSINRFGSLARFIDWQLRSQEINSELTDSYLVFPEEEVSQISQLNLTRNKKIYYQACYTASETITNLYNVAARVTVTFNVSPIYYSFEFFAYPATKNYYGMVFTFNDSYARVNNAYPFYCLVGNVEHDTGEIDYLLLSSFWLRNTVLKFHGKALSNQGSPYITVSYRMGYATYQPSVLSMHVNRNYNENDEFIIDFQSGKIEDKYGGSELVFDTTSEFIHPPISIQTLDNNRRPLVQYAAPNGADSQTMYNGDVSFSTSFDYQFSLEVIKHG